MYAMYMCVMLMLWIYICVYTYIYIRPLAIPLDAQKDTAGQAAKLKKSCSKGLPKGLNPNLPAPSRSHSFFAVSVPCLRRRSRKAAATLELLVAARALLGTAEAA